MRLLQGISAGGEWGGAALMAVEHAPPGKRGAYGSFSQIGVPAGLILAQLLFLAVTAWTTPEQFAAWGWRLPFLFSIVLVGIGLVVRLSLAESPVFTTLLREQARSSRPIVEVFRSDAGRWCSPR
jgi:MFS family permease